MTVTGSRAFLEEHLNVYWLRPEAALWDAIASDVVCRFAFLSPSLDLGSGNGIFSFITAGGAFSLEYDWYRNVDLHGFWDGHDIYDSYAVSPDPKWVIRKPEYAIDWAVDRKVNLLRQAQALGFYRVTALADASGPLPFGEQSFQTIFSNILYWLSSAESALREVWRLLRTGGHALLCLQDHKFKEYCLSYRWRELGSEALRLLNRGRSESSRWTISHSELMALARQVGFKVVSHSYYLSPLTLRAWDIGLRPLSPVLIRMVQRLDEADRLSIKAEWMEIVRPFLHELYDLDKRSKDQGGYHFVCLEKI